MPRGIAAIGIAPITMPSRPTAANTRPGILALVLAAWMMPSQLKLSGLVEIGVANATTMMTPHRIIIIGSASFHGSIGTAALRACPRLGAPYGCAATGNACGVS